MFLHGYIAGCGSEVHKCSRILRLIIDDSIALNYVCTEVGDFFLRGRQPVHSDGT
jgi:hypothetical protein